MQEIGEDDRNMGEIMNEQDAKLIYQYEHGEIELPELINAVRREVEQSLRVVTVRGCHDAAFHGIECLEMDDNGEVGFFKDDIDRRPSSCAWVSKEYAERLHGLFHEQGKRYGAREERKRVIGIIKKELKQPAPGSTKYNNRDFYLAWVLKHLGGEK